MTRHTVCKDAEETALLYAFRLFPPEKQTTILRFFEAMQLVRNCLRPETPAPVAIEAEKKANQNAPRSAPGRLPEGWPDYPGPDLPPDPTNLVMFRQKSRKRTIGGDKPL